MTKYSVTILVCATLLAGCQQPTMQQTREDAAKQWALTRAKMSYGVADEHLKAGQLDKAKAKAQEALSLSPQLTAARVLLGKIYIEQGNYLTACRELDIAIKEKPAMPEPHYLLGVAYEKDGKFDDALKAYNDAFAADNCNPAPVVAMAEVYVHMGQVKEAQVCLESHMNLAGDDPAMYEVAGRVAMMQRDYAKAVKYYTQARDLEFKNPLYAESLAIAHFRNGNHAEAENLLKPLAESQDRKDQLWVHRMLGDCYLAMGRANLARDQFQVMTENAPNDAQGWTGLATAALRLGDAKRAVLASGKALALEPENLDAALIRAYALIRDGQNDAAVTALTSASTLHPDSTTLYCLLGKACVGSGDQAAAVRNLQTALRLDPKNAAAKGLMASITDKKSSKETN